MEGTSEPGSRRNSKDKEENFDDGDWCAICHDGGDTLYGCDRCPKVYHLFCYIPALTEEPPDEWVRNLPLYFIFSNTMYELEFRHNGTTETYRHLLQIHCTRFMFVFFCVTYE